MGSCVVVSGFFGGLFLGLLLVCGGVKLNLSYVCEIVFCVYIREGSRQVG